MSRRAGCCDQQPHRKPRPSVERPHARGAALGQVAVPRAVALAAAIRDDTYGAVAEATDTLSRVELIALVVALAAMVPADVDPELALTWVEVPHYEWPDTVVRYEAARFEAGARDITARAGLEEHLRRRAATSATSRRAA